MYLNEICFFFKLWKTYKSRGLFNLLSNCSVAPISTIILAIFSLKWSYAEKRSNSLQENIFSTFQDRNIEESFSPHCENTGKKEENRANGEE